MKKNSIKTRCPFTGIWDITIDCPYLGNFGTCKIQTDTGNSDAWCHSMIDKGIQGGTLVPNLPKWAVVQGTVQLFLSGPDCFIPVSFPEYDKNATVGTEHEWFRAQQVCDFLNKWDTRPERQEC